MRFIGKISNKIKNTPSFLCSTLQSCNFTKLTRVKFLLLLFALFIFTALAFIFVSSRAYAPAPTPTPTPTPPPPTPPSSSLLPPPSSTEPSVPPPPPPLYLYIHAAYRVLASNDTYVRQPNKLGTARLLFESINCFRQGSNIIRMLATATADSAHTIEERLMCKANNRLVRPHLRHNSILDTCRWSTLLIDCAVESDEGSAELRALSEISLVGEHENEHQVCVRARASFETINNWNFCCAFRFKFETAIRRLASLSFALVECTAMKNGNRCS